MVTPLAYGTSTAVKQNAAVQELIEGFSDLLAECSVLVLESLLP